MAEGTVFRLDLVDIAIEFGWDADGTKSADEFRRGGITVVVQYTDNDDISSILRTADGQADEFFASDASGNSERLKNWLVGRSGSSQETTEQAGVVRVQRLRWSPGKGKDFLKRADGAEYSIATGHRGTYEWVVKDGLHAAYHYPDGVQSANPVILVAPQSSWQRAYRACVDHNKAVP